jgi:hypothetical protein
MCMQFLEAIVCDECYAGRGFGDLCKECEKALDDFCAAEAEMMEGGSDHG